MHWQAMCLSSSINKHKKNIKLISKIIYFELKKEKKRKRNTSKKLVSDTKIDVHLEELFWKQDMSQGVCSSVDKPSYHQ